MWHCVEMKRKHRLAVTQNTTPPGEILWAQCKGASKKKIDAIKREMRRDYKRWKKPCPKFTKADFQPASEYEKGSFWVLVTSERWSGFGVNVGLNNLPQIGDALNLNWWRSPADFAMVEGRKVLKVEYPKPTKSDIVNAIIYV
jgi:hypothetical protein